LINVYLHNKDIFDITEADTLVLPVDGTAPKLIGGIAHKFLKRIEVETLEEIFAPPLEYPFTGYCPWTRIEGCFPQTHFKYVCALGTLSHVPGADHAAVVRSALTDMLVGAETGGVGTKLAIPLLTGGGRLPPLNALHTMLREIEGYSALLDLEVHIAERNKERYEVVKTLMR